MAALLLVAVVFALKASITNAKENLEYVGCYPLQHLGHQVNVTTDSLDACAKQCRQWGNAYAGFKNRIYCHCHNNLTAVPKFPDKMCTFECVDSDRTCGGSVSASVYEIGPPITLFSIIFMSLTIVMIVLLVILALYLCYLKKTLPSTGRATIAMK